MANDTPTSDRHKSTPHERAMADALGEPDGVWDHVCAQVVAETEREIVAYFRRPFTRSEIEELRSAGYRIPFVKDEPCRPPVERGPIEDWMPVTDAEVGCLTCGRGPGDHLEWCWRGAEEREVRVAAEVAAAAAWHPSIDLPLLSDEERVELAAIFDRLTAEREQNELAEQARRARAHDQTRGARWIEAALQSEAETVRAAPHGLRNATLARSAWNLARLVCDGTVAAGDVLEALVEPALNTGLGRREVDSTIRAALRRRCTAA